MNFSNWIDALIEEKNIDLQQRFEVDGPSGANSIPVGCVVDAIKSANAAERAGIKNTIVKIDFANGDVLHFLRHLAQALAA